MRLAPGDVVVELDAYDSVGNALDVLEISNLVFMFKTFFFFADEEEAQSSITFLPVKPFQLSLLFASKARASLTLLANIRLGWKGLTETNDIADLASLSVTKKKKFYNVDTRFLRASS